jgi:putative membrane protein
VKNLRKISLAALILGVTGAIFLVGFFGFARVTHAILAVGLAKFALFAAWQLITMAFLGVAWWVVAATDHNPLPYAWGRMVRDSAGSCLPFSVLGGLVIGARAVTLCGISWHRAAVSTIVDVTTEFAAEIAFAGLGLVILLITVNSPGIRLPAEIGLGLAVVALIAVTFLQHGVAPIFVALGKRLLGPWIEQGKIDFGAEAELTETYGKKHILALGTVLHILGWVAKGLGNFIAFHLLGVEISLWAALAIEGLLHAALAGAVIIPGYAGVQEAGYIGLGALWGVPAELCLEVSLLRRARDIALGIPILLVWQIVEVKRLKPA